MEVIKEILAALGIGAGPIQWVIIGFALLRGVAATIAEQVPNGKLGGFAGVVDLLAGNNKNASGSQ